MSDPYLIPAKQARQEIRVSNSRFIATAAPAFTVEDARGFIATIKSEFSDASHNVPAFIIGSGPSTVAHSSDDGEPSGTAGRPALTVLRGSGLGDIAVVVTRYFGGTKLGTGGLVRAYGDAVKAVLAILPRAKKVSTHTVMIAVPYALLEQVDLLVKDHGGHLLDKEFAADVTLTVQIVTGQTAAFGDAIREFSRGRIELEIVATNHETIMPMDDGMIAK